jgi:hypothetical protein
VLRRTRSSTPTSAAGSLYGRLATSERLPDGDLKLLNSGKLGVGKKALARYRQLARGHAGERRTSEPRGRHLRRPAQAEVRQGPKTFLEKLSQGGNRSTSTA